VAASPLSPAEAACRERERAVVIDVGHHPAAPGAISARGVPEFVFNARLAETVRATLQGDGFARAQLLDAAGEVPALPQRVERVRAMRPWVLLSIHHDSVQRRYLKTWVWQGERRAFSDRFRGFSLFVSRRNGDFAASLAAARAIGTALVAAGFRPTLHHAEDIDGERRPLLDADIGLYAGDRLAILAHDGAPAVLIEAGVIVHRDEEAMLASTAFRHRFATAVTRGLANYCATAETGGGW
jgi:N-acetylmuramoyl-L-alanine amidase